MEREPTQEELDAWLEQERLKDVARYAAKAKEAVKWIEKWAEGDKVYVHPQLEQCLGKAQGVDYAAAGLCRVREDREAKWSTHRSTVAISGDRAAIAAHTRAARAAVSVTMHPASTSAATCDP